MWRIDLLIGGVVVVIFTAIGLITVACVLLVSWVGSCFSAWWSVQKRPGSDHDYPEEL